MFLLGEMSRAYHGLVVQAQSNRDSFDRSQQERQLLVSSSRRNDDYSSELPIIEKKRQGVRKEGKGECVPAPVYTPLQCMPDF